ncbi:methyltransferase-like 26 [Eurytemora carolleeae]|uniref:methyltransferase-like 26 n=1 Tax=Eurytemora carolleeae TaxID=1294199 RepID=UPI000C776C89|nr:methyltransferase-like 26 [Eurytemora carolleeae]XP_023330868.1 methyltransferase-like 26 [Eurytemora carolleeae]|eukprot:XP_023330867.1 methyltransferase-like 26 [Eurytemora affinis]
MGFRKLLNRIRIMFTNKRVPAAADRNKEAICSVLKKILPTDMDLRALEIASGSGLHAGHLAAAFPRITWIPSELDRSHWPSILAYKADFSNIENPLEIDVIQAPGSWIPQIQSQSIDIIININMIHISPWSATQGLFRAAGELLKKDGVLITYGPYSKNGILRPESNANFHRQLQNQNSEWGIRDITDLSEEGNEHGLRLHEEFDMPANNKILVFRRNTCLG